MNSGGDAVDETSRIRPVPRARAWVEAATVFALALALYLPGVGSRDLADRDEMRYVEVAREMIVEGRWAVPHLNQVLYSEKPPLFFWLMRVPNALEGDLTPAGARSVIAVMAALCVALTFAIGRLLLGPVGAGVSALALATSAEFARFSQTAVMDVPLALFVTAALFFYVLAKRRPTRASALPMAAAYASMGLGFMVKGPFGILLPAVVMACEGFRARGGRALKARHLRWGPLITIGILLAWVIPVIVSLGPDFVIDTLKRQLLTRAVGQAAPHAGPIWFYFAELPVEFLPWTIFVPFAFVATWRHRFAPPHPESAAEGLRFGAVWTVAMFVVLTAIKGKRDQYLMPLFPGAALLVGAWFEHVWHGVRREEHPWFEPTRKVVGAALAGTAALGLVGAFLVPVIVGTLHLEATEFASVMGTDGWMPLWWALLAAPLALAAAALIGRGRPPAVFAGVLLVGAALVLFTNLQVRPSLNWKRSGRWIGERMGELHRDGAVLGAFRWRMVGTYNYYGRVARIEDLISVEEFAAFLAGPGPRFVATDDKEIRRHRLTDVPGAYLVEEGPDSRASRRLFANAEGRDLYRRLYGPTGDLAERAPAPATSR